MAKPSVFIIESLDFEDEKKQRFEGKFLSEILRLGGKEAKYFYIRTKKELRKVLKFYKQCNYRYLHISCHGNHRSISTTLEKIPFQELVAMARPYLDNKRLFISSCCVVNDRLAEEVFVNTGCLSIIGPKREIYFHDAAIVWASFYHLVFKEDPIKMKRTTIKSTLSRIKNTFGVSVNYYAKSNSGHYDYNKILIT